MIHLLPKVKRFALGGSYRENGVHRFYFIEGPILGMVLEDRGDKLVLMCDSAKR